MKLLLTSAGLINQELQKSFTDQLVKPIEQNRVLIVAYAPNAQGEFYVNESKQQLQHLGLQDIVIANMHHLIDISSLGIFDVIYVCGGNTFIILNKLRESHLDNLIIEQVKSGTLYVGVSAGSIIAGPDIEIAGWGSEGDTNEIGLHNLEGFHLVELSVFPHFREELRSEVEDFKKKVDYKVIELSDEQGVLIVDSNTSIVGKK